MNGKTDAELVQMVRDEGESTAYEQLVRRHHERIYSFVLSIIRDWAEAEDLVQQAFIRGYTSLHTLKEPQKYSAWVRQIAFSTCMMWLRRYRPELYKSMEDPDELDEISRPVNASSTTPLEATLRKEMSEVIRSAVASLPKKYRIPLTMVHLEGASYQRVADALGTPIGTVKSRISRAKSKLKPTLSSYATMEEGLMTAESYANEMLIILEDRFYRNMHEGGEVVSKYALEDYDFELWGSNEVKIDFKWHWEHPQFSDYDPVFMLHCARELPKKGDTFTFYIVFHCDKLKEADGTLREEIIRDILGKYDINSPQASGMRCGPVWVPVYKGSPYTLTGLGSLDADGLYSLFVRNFGEVYPRLLERIERSDQR